MDSPSSPIGELKKRAAQQGWNTVFSLNEPDINGISPQTAANWYKRHINPLAISKYLVVQWHQLLTMPTNAEKAIPAVTSSTNAGQGLDWAAQFLSSCGGGCYFDYINLHWYGENISQFKKHIQNAHNRFPNNKVCSHDLYSTLGLSNAVT